MTVMNETITPTFVPELNNPVASARSRCGNHWPIALIDAGKLPASRERREHRHRGPRDQRHREPELHAERIDHPAGD
jgi:hypothetical protein